MYKLEINARLLKKIEKFPKADYLKIREKLIELQTNPRPRWVEKLKNRPAYRIAVGNYRIIYEIEEKKITILVLDIDDRKDVYRK